MNIVQLTDLHLRPEGHPAYRVVETNMLTARAFEAVRRLGFVPDLIVISGDLTDCGLDEEYAVLKALLTRLPAPVAMVPGNHDRRETFAAAFPDHAGIWPQPFTGFVRDVASVRVIGIDTVIPGSGAGALCDERLDALETVLAERRDAPTLIVMHHPPFNCGIRHMDRISLVHGRERLAGIIEANPQVQRILCGHHHRPIQAGFAGTIAQIAPSVAHQVMFDLSEDWTVAFAMEPPAFLVHSLFGDGFVSHQVYVEDHPGPYPFVLDADYPGKA